MLVNQLAGKSKRKFQFHFGDGPHALIGGIAHIRKRCLRPPRGRETWEKLPKRSLTICREGEGRQVHVAYGLAR